MKKFCNPKPMLKNLVGEMVIIKSRNYYIFYKGFLASFDEWMNLQLVLADEIVSDNTVGNVGDLFIKASHVLIIYTNNE